MTHTRVILFALCLLCALLLCSCDMDGLLFEGQDVQEEQDNVAIGGLDGFVGSFGGSFGNGAYEISTNENGEYVIVDENGNVVGNYVIVDGAFSSGMVITYGSVYDQIDRYEAKSFVESDQVTDYVRITVRDYGDIVIGLQSKYAPETVKNFQLLVESGFYNGLIFHRVIQNFMIQGGGYDVDGNVIPADTIAGEFTDNGFKNELRHVRGVVSMARTMDPNSASSQFFICDADSSHLDGQYAAFGVVMAGMEVVDAIAATQTNGSDQPVSHVVIESVTFVSPMVYKVVD